MAELGFEPGPPSSCSYLTLLALQTTMHTRSKWFASYECFHATQTHSHTEMVVGPLLPDFWEVFIYYGD